MYPFLTKRFIFMICIVVVISILAPTTIANSNIITNKLLISSNPVYVFTEGRAESATGPVDGYHYLTLRFYDSPYSTPYFIYLSPRLIKFDNGHFKLPLERGLDIPEKTFVDHDEVWMTFEIDSDGEMTPRIPLGYVPYSERSYYSDTTYYALDMADNSVGTFKLTDACIITEKIADGAVTNAKIAFDAVTTDKIADGAIMTIDIGQNGALDGDIIRWNGFYGTWETGPLLSGTAISKTDHPLDPENMYLQHAYVESPEMMNVYNGNITTDNSGYATVEMPDYFEALNTDCRYQLTVIGDFAQAIVSSEISNNRFTIRTDKPNVKVSWQVTGVRNDAHAQSMPMQVELDKAPEDRGLFLNPKAYGFDRSRSIDKKHDIVEAQDNSGN